MHVDATGNVDLGDFIDTRGVLGGSVVIVAGSDIVLRGVRGDSTYRGGPDGAYGGSVELTATRNVRILNSISLDGAVSPGSYGGQVCVTAGGSVSIEAPISLDGGLPNSPSGSLVIEANYAISVGPGGSISARSSGVTEGEGGISLTAGSTIATAARIDATGGFVGSSIEIEAGGDITLGGPIDARGFGPAPSDPEGGYIDVRSDGALLITAPVYTNETSIDLQGCDITVAGTGAVSNGNGYDTRITANGQLRIDGTVAAEIYGLDDGSRGQITIVSPEDPPPIFGASQCGAPDAAAVGWRSRNMFTVRQWSDRGT